MDEQKLPGSKPFFFSIANYLLVLADQNKAT